MKSKTFLIVLFSLYSILSGAQGLNIAYQPAFFSFAKHIVKVRENRFLIAGQVGAFAGFPDFDPYLRMVDGEGLTIWEEIISPPQGELGAILDLIVDEGGKIYVAFRAESCDVIEPDYIAQYDSLGNNLWMEDVAYDISNICIMPEATLGVLNSEGILQRFSLSSGTLWEVNLYENWPFFNSKGIFYGIDQHIYVLGKNHLVKLNASGQVVQERSVESGIKLAMAADGNSMYILTINDLERIDPTLSTIEETISVPEVNNYNLKVDPSGVYVLGRLENERMVTKLAADLQSGTSFPLLNDYFVPYDLVVDNDRLLFVGDEVPDPFTLLPSINNHGLYNSYRQSNIFLYATDTLGNASDLQDDAGVVSVSFTDIQLDTLGSCPPPGEAGGNVAWSNIKITIENTGTTILDQVTLNAAARACTSICPSFNTASLTASNLQLQPGESTVINWGSLTFFWVNFPDLNELCFWTTRPNGQMDGDHSNNQACADITIDTREVLNNPKYLILSPNPVKDQLRVQLMDHKVLPESYRIVDLMGKSILENTWPNGQHTLEVNVEGYPAGVYLMQINTHSQALIQQFVITGD